MSTFLGDLRYAARGIRKHPRFSMVVVLTLGLAIGASTVAFSATHALILRPFGFGDTADVVALMDESEQCRECDVAPGNFVEWVENTTTFARLAAYRSWRPNLSGAEAAEPLRAAEVTPGFFEVLGARMELGIPPPDEADAASRAVVISEGLWRRRFGGDSAIVGRELLLNGRPHVVTGVVRRHHAFPAHAEVWATLTFTPEERANRMAHYLGVIGRLRPGATVEAAQAELSAVARVLAREHPESNRGWDVRVERFDDWVVQGPRPYIALLAGAVAFLLLIATANVANLMFAQATARRREIAVRSALGASRFRIVRQLLTESVLLAVIAGGAGVLLAAWGLGLLRTAIPADLARYLPGWENLRVDPTVLLFTLGIALTVGMLCGLAPAAGLLRRDSADALRDGARGATGGARGSRSRRALVVSQIALATVLVTGTGLMVQSFVRMMRADPGFRAEGVLTMEISPPPGSYATGEPLAAFYEELVERVKSLPGVERAAVANSLPMSRSGGNQYFNVVGRLRTSAAEAPTAGYRVVSRDYPATMGIPLRDGRLFSAADGPAAAPVVLINESFASRHFPGADPIGERLEFNARTYEIVGVVGDVRHAGPREGSVPELFLPHSQAANRQMTLVIRSGTPPLQLTGAVVSLVGGMNRDVGVTAVRSMEQVVAEFFAPERVTTAQMGVFALIALLTAAIGIYGVMMFAVLQRTHEIGVRTALGAGTGAVIRLVVGQGMRITALGLGLGVLGALGLTRLMTGLLFDVTATDPLTFAATSGFLAVVAMAACWAPARRAARIDPMIALRSE